MCEGGGCVVGLVFGSKCNDYSFFGGEGWCDRVKVFV